MREELKKYYGQIVKCEGIFHSWGKRTSIVRSKGKYRPKHTPTMLVKNLKVNNIWIDHIWIDCNEKINIDKYDKVQFTAYVELYIKGHHNPRKNKANGNIMDYGLTNITNLKRIEINE